jgi:hypothetical protein
LQRYAVESGKRLHAGKLTERRGDVEQADRSLNVADS